MLLVRKSGLKLFIVFELLVAVTVEEHSLIVYFGVVLPVKA